MLLRYFAVITAVLCTHVPSLLNRSGLLFGVRLGFTV